MPLGSGRKRRVATLVLRHVCLPLCLSRQCRKPSHIALPVEIVHRIANHKHSVLIAINLHIEDSHFTLSCHYLGPHLRMHFNIFAYQFLIVSQFQCLTISFHFFSHFTAYNAYKSTTAKHTDGTTKEV